MTTGCQACIKRRVKCDEARPSCNKCRQKDIECPGYGFRYRFRPSQTQADEQVSRLSSRSSQTPGPQDLLWPDGSYTSSQQPSSPCADAADGDAVGQTDQLSLCAYEARPPYLASPTVPQSLEWIDPTTRGLFDHFSTSIAPVMVPVDSDFNGYRSLLLPLATTDNLVRAAVCVASLDYHSHQSPAIKRRAELGLQYILSQLRQRTSAHMDLADVSAWATIIVLLTAETITGGSNFPSLFKILQHLAAANTANGRSSVLHAFLAEQTRMMTLFAQPLLEEEPSTLWDNSRSQASMDFITNVAIFRPDLSKELEVYKAAIRTVCDIYVTRAALNPSHTETTAQLDQLKAICERVHSNTPGHHTLVWVYFIAAAESSTLEHRQFFTTRLQEVYTRTRFNNIPTALKTLHEIWKMQNERRWTELLPDVMPVFII